MCLGVTGTTRGVAHRVLGALALVLLLAVAGCAPRTPDAESWTDQALQALDDVGSEVATATLVLRQERGGRATAELTQTVVLESEEAAGTTADGFASAQPPPGQDEEYARVTTALSDAVDLLSEVRIAVVREDTDRYAALVERLVKAGRDLDATARAVQRP